MNLASPFAMDPDLRRGDNDVDVASLQELRSPATGPALNKGANHLDNRGSGALGP
jgi:hypothetical protein